MRTQENLATLVEALQTNCGDFYTACRTAMLSPQFVRTWMKDDEHVNTAIEEATRVGAMQLESAAIKRAVHGVEKGVWYQGECVGVETQYSDGLLTTLLKANMPEKYAVGDGGTKVNVNLAQQIQIMPRANTYEEWLAFTQAKPALLEGGVLEAEAVPVLPPVHSDPCMADIL